MQAPAAPPRSRLTRLFFPSKRPWGVPCGSATKRIASAGSDIAEAQVIVARAGGLPQLRLNATQSHVMESARAQAVGQVFNQPNTYFTNVTLSQSIFQGGRVVAAARGARRVRAASRLEESEARDQLAFDVQWAYLQALFAAARYRDSAGELPSRR